MRKAILSAVAIAGVMGLAGAAQAQCWWSGLGYSCVAPPAAYAPPVYDPPVYAASPYAAFTPYAYWDYRYKPDWLPSYPGPKPSGGSGAGF